MISRGDDTREAFLKIVDDCLGVILQFETGARERSPEALHRMRVGVRRLRSGLTTFKPVLEPEQIAKLRDELKWLQGVLGRCRDWDVFLHRNVLPALSRLHGYDNLREFAALCNEQRETAYDELFHVLENKRYQGILFSIRSLPLEKRLFRPMLGKQPIVDFADKTLRKRAKAFRRYAGRLDFLSESDLHEMRKQAKKLRYAMEFFASLYPDRIHRHIELVTGVQDAIGAMVDVVAGEKLIDVVSSTRNVEERGQITGAGHIVVGWMGANSASYMADLHRVVAEHSQLKPFS